MSKYFLAEAEIEGDYRYWLHRAATHRDIGKPYILWVMLNPSTADGQQDDPTIRKVMGFSALLGYGNVYVVNKYAYRATDPTELRKVLDPVGPKTDSYIQDWARFASRIVVAWGRDPALVPCRAQAILNILVRYNNIYCLGHNNDGSPKHPLMLPYRTPFEIFKCA